MDALLLQGLQCVGQSIKEGNHNAAESVIRSLQAIDDPVVVQWTMHILKNSGLQLGHDVTYVHFAAFRLLRFYLVRHRALWKGNTRELLHFLSDYVETNKEEIVTPPWHSVLSEASLDAAVVIKLTCANAEGDMDPSILSDVVSEVLFLLDERQGEAQIIFVRHIMIHVVEEFGLYRPSSRGRGMPLRFHRACRSSFECDGLVRFLNALLCYAINATSETPRTIEALFSGLGTILSWSSYRFFEEDVTGEETNYTFRVSGGLWNTLLLEGISISGSIVSIDSLLHTWYSKGNVCGFFLNPLSLVELICQFCAITVDSWSISDKVNYGERFLSLSYFVAGGLLTSALQYEDACAILPLALSGIRNIVENFEDIFTIPKIRSSCVSELSLFTKTLIELDSQIPDNDGIMTALDESLSCLFKIVTTIPCHNSSSCSFTSAAGMEVLNTFLSVKLLYAHSSEEADHFSDSFAMSHLSLVGHLARLDAEQAVISLCQTLEELQGRYVRMDHLSASERIQVQECLWLVLKIVNAFLADACEGEKVSIPSCFSGIPMVESHPVFKIISSLLILKQTIVEQFSLASPALVSSLLEIFGTFIAVYVIRDDESGCVDNENPFFFAQERGMSIISFTLHALRTFALDEEVTLAGCRVLDITAKSKGIVPILQSYGILQAVEEMIISGEPFYEDVRGRIAGFWIRSAPSDILSEHILSVLHTFDIHSTDFASVDVSLCLERCSSLSGLLISLQESERLTSCVRILMDFCDHVLSVSERRFYEKEITIRSTELVLNLFLTCSVSLRGDDVIWLFEKLRMILTSVMKTLAEDPMWNSESAEEEKHRLLKMLSRLFCEVSRWSMMEATLSSDAMRSLGSSLISSLAIFLKLFNERSLSFPELRETVFDAFQLSAEAFTSEFVASSDSQVFLSTLLFALNSESVEFQRVGITVADRVVTYLRDSGLKNHELFAQLLSIILRGFALGKLSFSLASQLARSFSTLCGCLAPEAVELVFMETVKLSPDPNFTGIMQGLMAHIQECLTNEGTRNETALRGLAEAIADGLGNIRGALLV